MKTHLDRKSRNLVIFGTISTVVSLVACSTSDNGRITTPGQSADTSSANASVRGYADSALRGSVQFAQLGDSVNVTAAIYGLQPGKAYAIHVHQFGNCSSPDSSGEHFARAGQPHGDPYDSAMAHHLGDLPNLQVGAAGIGQMTFTTAAFTLDSADSNSIIGRSVVVHMNADDYVSQPAGNSGARIACGVIRSGSAPDTAGTGPDTTGTVDTTKTGNNPGGYGGPTGVPPGNQ